MTALSWRRTCICYEWEPEGSGGPRYLVDQDFEPDGTQSFNVSVQFGQRTLQVLLSAVTSFAEAEEVVMRHYGPARTLAETSRKK
jgi:hypothetical protein